MSLLFRTQCTYITASRRCGLGSSTTRYWSWNAAECQPTVRHPWFQCSWCSLQ